MDFPWKQWQYGTCQIKTNLLIDMKFCTIDYSMHSLDVSKNGWNRLAAEPPPPELREIVDVTFLSTMEPTALEDLIFTNLEI
jgi:hypothetical protein